jgi:hypothetical protein
MKDTLSGIYGLGVIVVTLIMHNPYSWWSAFGWSAFGWSAFGWSAFGYGLVWPIPALYWIFRTFGYDWNR